MRWRLGLAVLFLGAVSLAEPRAAAGLRVDQFDGNVPQNFIVSGAAFGADAVHVWAWPASGPVFLGTAVPTLPDRVLNAPSGGFSLAVTNAPVGSYWIVLYAHDATTGDFLTQQSFPVTVRACQWQLECWPFLVAGAPSFAVFSVCR